MFQILISEHMQTPVSSSAEVIPKKYKNGEWRSGVEDILF